MARKEAEFVIEQDGRDKGKVFFIREMPAFQAEDWAFKVILAMNRGNAELALDPMLGMQAFAGFGTPGFNPLQMLFSMVMSFQDAKALLDELMSCVSIKPDRNNPNLTRPLLPEDTEEILTRVVLKKEVMKLHVGFSSPGSE